MGAVYLGEHLLIGNPVAVKLLHAKHAEDPAIVERFRREAQATTAIRHHNIVGMFDLGQLEDGSLYLVMEYLEGRDWAADLEKEGPQPIAKVVHILSQACDALGAAHEAGIVHRDIKPENIFLVRRSGDPNFVKVLDFGISKIREGAAALAPSKTQTGTAMGTPYYMSPEQVQGRKDIDGRTDIYALGVVLFQALTGQYPFDGDTFPMLVMSIVTQPTPHLGTYRPDLPPELQHVLERMVAKDPAQRFGSVEEVKAALAPFASFADQPTSAVASVPRPPLATPIQSEVRPVAPATPPARSRTGLIVLALGALGLVLLGAIAGAAIVFWPSPSGETVSEPAPQDPARPSTEGPGEPKGAAPSSGEETVDPPPSDVARSEPSDSAPDQESPASADPPKASSDSELATDAPPRGSPAVERTTDSPPPVTTKQRRRHREPAATRTPEARPLAPSAPVEMPRPRPTQAGTNDALILR